MGLLAELSLVHGGIRELLQYVQACMSMQASQSVTRWDEADLDVHASVCSNAGSPTSSRTSSFHFCPLTNDASSSIRGFCPGLTSAQADEQRDNTYSAVKISLNCSSNSIAVLASLCLCHPLSCDSFGNSSVFSGASNSISSFATRGRR
jgi:hypothetical protein